MSAAQETPVFGRTGGASEQMQGPGPCGDRKEWLQDELAELLLRPESDPDSGRLDELLAALDEVDPIPEDDLPDTEESLQRFRQRYAEFFPAEGPAAEASSPSEKRRPRRVAFRFTAAAAVVVLLAGTLAAQALGADVFGAVARWSSEVFRFQSDEVPYATINANPLEEGETAYYETLEEALEAFGITEKLAPTWVPERFELVEVAAANRTGGICIYADYEYGDECFGIQYNEETNSNFRSLEREEGYMGVYLCGNIKFYLMSDLGRQKAFWQNGELECQMAGNVSEQEMKDIINSIY